MSIEFGRFPVPPHSGTARVRGAAAGSVSGTLAVAAHGWAYGGMAVSSSTLALLAASSALIGSLVAGLAPLRDSVLGLTAALVAGQLLGHLTMGWSSGHPQHGNAQLTPTVITAHVVAAVATAMVIRGAETAYRIGGAVLDRTLPQRYRPPAIPGPLPLRAGHRDRVVLRIFAAESLRTRGPPLAMLFRLSAYSARVRHTFPWDRRLNTWLSSGRTPELPTG